MCPWALSRAIAYIVLLSLHEKAVKQNWSHLYFRGQETGSEKLSNVGDTPSWGSSMMPARQVFLSTCKASTMAVRIKPQASAWQSSPSRPKTWLSSLISTPHRTSLHNLGPDDSGFSAFPCVLAYTGPLPGMPSLTTSTVDSHAKICLFLKVFQYNLPRHYHRNSSLPLPRMSFIFLS